MKHVRICAPLGGLALLLFVLSGCASSNGVQCDPAAEACACDPAGANSCAGGYACGDDGVCVVEIDGGGGVDGPAGDAGPDAAPGLGFGEPCTDRSQCESNICIVVGIGGRCSDLCQGGDCPEGFGCLGVLDSVEVGQVDEVCVPISDQICSPCTAHSECTLIGMDLCIADPDGDSYCSRDCSAVSCPTGYACETVDIGGGDFEQCVPTSGWCDCTADVMPGPETCQIMTPFATLCTGARTCLGATGWSGCGPLTPDDDPDGSFIDADCDGIDGDVGRGIFVSTLGIDPPANATCGLLSTNPCRTVATGVVRAVTTGRPHVYVQAGSYSEVVTLVNGVSIYGGYNLGWQRASHTTAGHQVFINGARDASTGEFMTLKATGLIVAPTIADLTLRGPVATEVNGTGDGKASYVVWASGSVVNLYRVTLEAGDGYRGDTGANGSDASVVDRQGFMNGGNGGDGDEFDTVCNTSSEGGPGTAGSNSCSGPSSRLPNGGAGGQGGEMDTSCGPIGICATGGNCNSQSGDPGAAAAYTSGSWGQAGSLGVRDCGSGGGGGTGLIANGAGGSRVNGGAVNGGGFWYANGGGVGGTGQNGGGGGGGGGAAGCDTGTDSYGPGGGGGGAGGCAALSGGGGGRGGGGSFGVFAVGGANVTMQTCTIYRGTGGAGGAGGIGGRGQSGGLAGAGGIPEDSGNAGGGGVGAHGGHGGGGAGGQGGRSIGAVWTSGSTVTQDCTITGGSAGAGGAGGASAPGAPVAERDGNVGQSGTAGSLAATLACGASC